MAQRPANTYVSQVFNFGVDKNIPLGFVNVVYNKNGSLAGYLRNGKFYEPGEKLPETKTTEGTQKQYSGSIAERIAQAKKEVEESKKAKAFSEAKGRDTLSQKEATAKGDILDNYATSLKPQMDEYEFKLDLYARKIAKGDKLSVIEEKEIDDISKKYSSIKKAYDEARQDAVDMYYGNITTPTTKTGKKIQSQKPEVFTSIEKPKDLTPTEVQAKAPSTTTSKVTTPVVKTPGKKGKVVKEEVTTINPETGETIKVSDIKPATGEKVAGATVGPNAIPPVDKEAAAEKIVSSADFGLSEALFKNIPSLKSIFDKYVDPNSGMTDDEFRKLIRQDVWYKQNSKEIKNRFVQFYNYEDLKNSGQATGTSDYEKQIATIESNLKKRAVELGSAAASDPAALRKAAENLYLTDRSEDDSFITDFLASSIRPVAGMIGGKATEGYSGQALQNYNALLQTARNNGFKISDILPGAQNEQQVLGAIASGKIDINRVAQDARKLAAQGQPQYVRDLLAQGYDLAQVYQPYRQTMANILEIDDPNQIDLNDPTLRMAITDKGDMNVYDFKKALKQDNRWQYTENARNEVSSAALNVLRDFGFQG
jgi:hypothetical protein